MSLTPPVLPKEWIDLPLTERLNQLATWSFNEFGDQGHIEEFMEAKARIEVLEEDYDKLSGEYDLLEEEHNTLEEEFQKQTKELANLKAFVKDAAVIYQLPSHGENK